MTTIATDGRSMAGDSLITGGGERLGYTAKVRRTKDGRVYGSCGKSTDAEQFARWIEDPTLAPKLSEEFEALVLNSDGSVHYVNDKLTLVPYMVPMTIGSGAGLALGAMLAGKSPSEAVAVAIERDIHSGGKILELDRDATVPRGFVLDRMPVQRRARAL